MAADIVLTDGRTAKVVVVAERTNPNGLALLVNGEDGAPLPVPFGGNQSLIAPGDLIEILLLQERAFGTAGLPRPEVSA